MKQATTSKQFFFALNITYYMQAFAVLFFALVVWFLISQGSEPVSEDKMWMVIVPIVMVMSLTASHFVFRMNVGRIDKSLPLKTKMPKYANALIIRSALLELP